MAHAFDPSGWLTRFEDAGGWWVVVGPKITLGWMLNDLGNSGEEAARLWRELVNVPGHRAAVRETLLCHREG